MRTKIMIGGLLLILSIKPLFQMGQEFYYQNVMGNKVGIEHLHVNFIELGKVEILGKGIPIDVQNVSIRNTLFNGDEYVDLSSFVDYEWLATQPTHYERVYSWSDQEIRVEDQFRPGNFYEDSRELSNLKITINETDWSMDGLVEVRPLFFDENRYHGYFGVLMVTEQKEEKLVFVQRVSGNQFVQAEELAWRTLSIEKDGHVQEDYFTYEDRAQAPNRVSYINHTMTSPFSLGYKSEILQGWPSLFFPFLYPLLSGSLGFLLIILAILPHLKKMRKT